VGATEIPPGKMNAQTRLDSKADPRAGFDRFTPEAITVNRPIVELVATSRRGSRLPERTSGLERSIKQR